MTFTILIPARLASTRLPNKPLADIAGLPMVVRVARRVAPEGAAASTQRIVVATDSQSILDACSAHGVEAVLTRTDHASGSDRLAEACELLGLPDDHIVVNVQGDEPLIDPRLVQAVARLLDDRQDVPMSTAAHPIHTLEEFTNPNVVKVVVDAHRTALYFSRAPLPWSRDKGIAEAWWRDATRPASVVPLRHIGIYGYRAGFLRRFPQLPRAPLEELEALEQLRVVWHGHRIAVHLTLDDPGPGVDTAQDLERVRRMLGH